MANDVSRPAVASTTFLSSNGKPFAIVFVVLVLAVALAVAGFSLGVGVAVTVKATSASESNISMLSTPNNTRIIILKGATVIDGTEHYNSYQRD